MTIALRWLMPLLLLAPFVAGDPGGPIPAAYADDDDDRDDDDDDDDDEDDRPAPAAAPAPPIAVPGEIVVAALTANDLARIEADGFTILAVEKLLFLDGVVARLAPPDRLDLDDALERLHLIAPDAAVEANHLYRPVEMPCGNHDCLAFEMIGWAVPPERCAIGETIGMIDTAVNAGHEALAGQDVEIVSVMAPGEAGSGAMHGTAIAALLVGDAGSRTPGLLPQAGLVAVEAFHRDAAGDAADVYKIVRSLDALGRRDVRIVNLSFAGPANAVLEHAVAHALESGMILVAAAGNGGMRAEPAFPGAFPGVIAVTAVDREREPYRHAGRGLHIAFAAPGVGVWTAASIEGGRFRSGTSYAVPFVSAAVAATLARDPRATAASVIDGLAAASADLGEVGRDPVFGWGLVTAPDCADGAPPM